MTTVVVQDPEMAKRLISERRARGQDRYDEVRRGVYYVVPVGTAEHGRLQAAVIQMLAHRLASSLVVTGPINLGEEDDYRIPDAAAVPAGSYQADQVWVPWAELVAEIRSMDDDTFEKFDHYAGHGVREIIVVDLVQRDVAVFHQEAGSWVAWPASLLLTMDSRELAEAIGL